MKVLRVLVPAVLKFVTLTALLFSTPLRAGVVLPDSGGFLVDDFLIFSLAEINFRAGEGISPHPGDPFHVASAPGQIKDEIILATGSNNGPLNDNPAGIDDAYRTPTGDTDTTFNTITIEDGGDAIRDRQNRHLFTLRLTKLLRGQDLKLSLFNFYSPSDKDGYLRLNIAYKIRDSLKAEAGGNIFYGQKDHSFFGQFKDNSNIFTALHYDF